MRECSILRKKQGTADNRNMRRGASCYRFYYSHSVGCFIIGGKDSQSFGEVSAPATSYNNGNSQNTLPETSAPDNNSSAPDNNSSAPVTDLKPGTAEINRSGSSETSGNSFLVHDDGVYLLGISNVNDAVTDGYAISAMIPDSYLLRENSSIRPLYRYRIAMASIMLWKTE